MDTRHFPGITRRAFIGTSVAAGIGSPALAVGQSPQPAATAPQPAPLNRLSRMVQEDFVERVREVERSGLARKAALATRSDAENYVREVRARIRECFVPVPAKTPLNARVTGVLERDAYRIERIVFESRPGFLVTANLYVPRGRSFPRPGVVASCGHTDNGKADRNYQSFVQGLARLGYVVLIYDPLGQGERVQYPDEKGKSRIGLGTREHIHAGNQLVLVGESMAMWRAWDGVRALDYLLTRPEVDSRHIGITGNSGGGTMTTWLCGIESRWTMAAPGCFITTFRRNVENELPADSEQYPPGCLARGLDMDDFLAAMAPRPVIILAKEKDFFDIRGAEESYGRLRRLYGLLGAEQNIALNVGPTGHGYSQESREAMYRWFHRATGGGEVAAEPGIVVEKDEDLWCTPGGSVAAAGSKPVYSFTREKAASLRASVPAAGAEPLAGRIRSLLKVRDFSGTPEYRIFRRIPGRGYPLPEFTTYMVETEPRIHAVVYRLSREAHLSRPSAGPAPAVLYVAHQSSDEELRTEPLLKELVAEPGSVFYACDVRGIGESRPDTCGENQFLSPYGSDYFYAGHALMLERPYLGMRTSDVLRVLEWLRGFGHAEVHLVAKGWGTVPATFAAVLAPTVKRVTLKNALTSYADVAASELYGWPLALLPPGAVGTLDLPECYQALESRGLRLIDPKGAGGV